MSADRGGEADSRAVPGWQDGSSGIPTQLAGVTIFDGKPRDGASLVYDRKKTLAREWIATWSLTKGQAYWLSCSYQGTVLTLERRLPPDASHCTVTYERDTQVAGLPAIQAMSCQ
ncbi:MAG: hypothetical protein IT165_32775 [Bryobacterales bacterium]|nr:hypothetical protein [Bryobacterales bacterium]